MAEEQSLLMVTVSGPDRPGITAAFTKVLMEHGVELVDVEQASLSDLLGLYFLLDLAPAAGSKDSVIKDLLFEASRLGLKLEFKLAPAGAAPAAGAPRMLVVTFFGGARALHRLSTVLAEEGANIERISTARHHDAVSIELMVGAGAGGFGGAKRRLMAASRELEVDLAIQGLEAYRKNKRLVFFDMDSTLIELEVIDELARRAGVGREVARITEKAMRGDFDFEESLTQRVALLKGLAVSELEDLSGSLPLSAGVEELAASLKWLGYKLGLVTGGFDLFAARLQKRLGLDFAFANRLEVKGGRLTGRVEGDVVDAAKKAQLVNQTACEEGILLDQVVVVGDGANDALMLGQAGLGIAYNAKPALERVANVSVGRHRLTHLFHFLGVTQKDVAEARACGPPGGAAP
jgi:phosphoserine phosphatase